MRNSENLEKWILSNSPLIPRQKIAISVSAVFCLLSVAVCMPMGGAGGQSLFKTKSDWAYWPFYFLSPILYLLLCGRALYRLSKSLAAPTNDYFEAIRKPAPPLSKRALRFFVLTILALFSGAINAYNAMEYLPYRFALVCVGPSLMIPGFVSVPAFIEYHQRILSALHFLFHEHASYKKKSSQLQHQLAKSKRQYRQLTTAERHEANAVFFHPFTHPTKKIRALLNLSLLLKKPPVHSKKPKIALAFGVLGFLIGSIAEFYSYRFGKKMAVSTGPVLSSLFGVTQAYVRMGLSAVATMDVFSDAVDDTYCFYKNGSFPRISRQGMVRLGLFLLALTAALPTVQNQIKTMGHEGFFGHVLSICAMIAPACVTFWAGDLVFRDYRYSTSSLSFMECHDRLSRMSDNCRHTGDLRTRQNMI